MTQDAFHFLRPEWLWALIPAAVLGWFLIRRAGAGATESWIRYVDPHLLRHLAIGGARAKRSMLIPIVGGAMVAALVLGLAGPTWKQAEVPSFAGGEPVVAVLSLSQSMNADDLTPTRLKRSVHKLRDILHRTKGDERGLVIYSDASFVAAPLTSDPQVIEQMLPELSTTLMPVLGNRLDLAIAEAQALLERAHAARGQIVVLADDAGNDPKASIAAARAAARAGYAVSVLGAGTEEGATLHTADGRAIASQNGQTFMTRLSKSELEQIAQVGGGTFSMITPDGADLDLLLPATDADIHAAGDRMGFQADAWVDMGYWLLILPVALLPFAFRRGLVFSVALVIGGLTLQPGAARAGTFENLWATPDQQGQTAFDAGAFDTAVDLFTAPEWRAASAYRAGDYAIAAQGFAGNDYNLGNALARAGRFEEALAAYDAALEAEPQDADAQFNRDLIARLLEQQEQDQQKPDDQSPQQEQQSGGRDQQQNPQSGGQQDQQAGAQTAEDEQRTGDDQPPGVSETSEQQNGAEDEAPHSADQAQSEKTDGEPRQGQTEGSQPDGTPPDPQSAAEPSSDPQQAEAGQNEAVEERGLTEVLSDLLNGNEEEPQQPAEGGAAGSQQADQAIEQQLRRVPDDPSGLLRARIRQHYAQNRSGG